MILLIYDGHCHTCTIWVAICLLDQARFAVCDPATGEALCTDPAAPHHYEAKWMKVDRIRSLQIRRRWAPGTRFKRPFEIPDFTHAVHATWSGAPAATRPAAPWGAAGTDAPYNAEHGPPLPHIPESKTRPAKSWPTKARHVLSHPPPIK